MKAKVFGIAPTAGSKRQFDILTIVINDKKTELRIFQDSAKPFKKAPFACICEYENKAPDYIKKRKYKYVDEKMGEIIEKEALTLYAKGEHFTAIDYDALADERADDIASYFNN